LNFFVLLKGERLYARDQMPVWLVGWPRVCIPEISEVVHKTFMKLNPERVDIPEARDRFARKYL
jgi:hypothetical protein